MGVSLSPGRSLSPGGGPVRVDGPWRAQPLPHCGAASRIGPGPLRGSLTPPRCWEGSCAALPMASSALCCPIRQVLVHVYPSSSKAWSEPRVTGPGPGWSQEPVVPLLQLAPAPRFPRRTIPHREPSRPGRDRPSVAASQASSLSLNGVRARQKPRRAAAYWLGTSSIRPGKAIT